MEPLELQDIVDATLRPINELFTKLVGPGRFKFVLAEEAKVGSYFVLRVQLHDGEWTYYTGSQNEQSFGIIDDKDAAKRFDTHYSATCIGEALVLANRIKFFNVNGIKFLM